jgi:hypothetical protein
MATVLDRILGLNAQLSTLDVHIEQVSQELSMLRRLDDDATRDATVSQRYEDRAAAKMTGSDVARMEKHLLSMEMDRVRMTAKRDRLIKKLADP